MLFRSSASVSDALVEAVDLYPTFAELAGLPPPGSGANGYPVQRLEGRSIVPSLVNASAPGAQGAFSRAERKSGGEGKRGDHGGGRSVKKKRRENEGEERGERKERGVKKAAAERREQKNEKAEKKIRAQERRRGKRK